MMLLLSAFEKLYGLKINFHKSKLFCFGQAKESYEQYSNIFGCKIGEFPVRYLGIPMHDRNLNNNDWLTVEQRIEEKLSSWNGKHMSVGGRLVLINLVLSSLVMFMISFFEIPKGDLKKLIIIDPISFGKVMNIKRNKDSQDGTLYVSQKISVDLLLII